MKQLGRRLAAAFLACGFAALVLPLAASAHRAVRVDPPPRTFGSPPSGAIPIIYNDRHVYSKPDTLQQGRVLAALVYNDTILIPLRSMFEQMGATVSYDSLSQTVTVSKPGGAEVRLTIGQPEVVIDGEARPLDVPPIMYEGTVLVPMRVIAEGMGAYVQWLPDRHVVVVRYEPVVPMQYHPRHYPPQPPAAQPQPYRDAYVVGDYIVSPRVYNEFSPGNTGTSSYNVRGTVEFHTGDIPWMVEGSFTSYQYPHYCNGPSDSQCYVSQIGNAGTTYIAGREEEDRDGEIHLGARVLQPRIYVGVGYLWRSSNYGYPQETGFGFGAEKLPDLNQTLSIYGSVWYYPLIQGQYVDTFGVPYNLAYRMLKYQIGGAWVFGSGPLFLDFGWIGDKGTMASNNDPDGYSHSGPYIGLGVKI